MIELEGTAYQTDQLPETGEDEWQQSIIDFVHSWQADHALTIPTSGTTGESQEIQIFREQMEKSAHRTATLLGLEQGMNALLCLNPKYIAGRMMIARALAIDMDLVAVRPTSNPVRELSPDRQIDFAAFVPLQMQTMIADNQAKRLDEFHSILIGGAPCSAPLEEDIQGLQVPVYESFGMTETLSHIALRRMNGAARSDAFHPLEGVSLTLDKDNCLIIEVDYLPSPIHTRDIVDLRGDRSFVWLGRKDNLINSGGVKVIPERLEKTISEPLVGMGIPNRFFVTGIPDPNLGDRVALVLEGECPLQAQEILSNLSQVVDAYEMPKELIVIDRFADTATGKIDRTNTLPLIDNTQ